MVAWLVWSLWLLFCYGGGSTDSEAVDPECPVADLRIYFMAQFAERGKGGIALTGYTLSKRYECDLLVPMTYIKLIDYSFDMPHLE